VARGGRRGNRRGNGVWVGLYRSALVRRREGEGEWSRDRAQDGGPTWLSGGRPAGAARAVEGGVGRRVEQDKGGADLQVLGGGRWQRSRARQRAEVIGDSRKTMEDLGAISQNCRDPTVMI
jgi:hypothetical protein